MIGTRFDKPLQDDRVTTDGGFTYVDNPAPNTYKKYAEAACWCNENNATIEDKGDYYEVVAIPDPTVDEVRERKLSELNSKFDAWRTDGATLISSLGFEADADEKANADVTGLVTLGESATFMDANNVAHELTIDELKILQTEIIESGSKQYQVKWAYREQINAATTVEELNAIEIVFTPIDFTPTETTSETEQTAESTAE